MTEEKTAPPLLDLEGVSKIYGELHALDNVSLQVPAGQWVSIVGPSGSGKTTLMNIVGCMDTPSRGKVLLDGHDISDLTGDELTEIRRSTIGLVFQQFHLIGHLTALENIMVAQYYHSMPDEKEAMEALDRVGLADRATHLPRQLWPAPSSTTPSSSSPTSPRATWMKPTRKSSSTCSTSSTRKARPSWSSPMTPSSPARASARSPSTTGGSSKKPGTITTSKRETARLAQARTR